VIAYGNKLCRGTKKTKCTTFTKAISGSCINQTAFAKISSCTYNQMNNCFTLKLLYIIMPAIMLFGITGCFTVRSNQEFSYSKLSPAAYKAVLTDSSNYYLVDVRTAKEYRLAHIAGAVNFSYLNFHIGRDVESLDRDKLVLVYCQTCHRSPLAARKMKKMGFRKVYDLKGGYQKWTVHHQGS
jgi:rhodanese-related sulfurtransferase